MKPVKPHFPSELHPDQVPLWKRSLRPNHNWQINTLYRETDHHLSLGQVTKLCNQIELRLQVIGFGCET